MNQEYAGSVYYPQACCLLRLRLEDFSSKTTALAKDSFEIYCLAKKVTVNINDYNSADTFNLELDYDSFPFDPRSIRACGVIIGMEDMRSLYKADGSFNKIQITKENMVFVGFADEEKISFDDAGRTVTLEGRDFTSLLIDRKYLEGNISLSRRAGEVIRSILAKLDETRDLKLEFRGIKESDIPILSSFYSDKAGLSGRKNVKKNQTYWELIQSIVSDAGLIAYIELDTLVITKPQTLFDKKQAKRFIYGKNLKSLEFSRKIGRQKGFNIIVRCIDIESKQVIEAKIPMEASNQWASETGISNTEVKRVKPKGVTPKDKNSPQQNDDEPAEYIAFRVSNVANKRQLIEIGQSIYLEMSRQQLEGSFKTKEMAIHYIDENARRNIFNVLKLRVGTPLDIQLDIRDKEAVENLKKNAKPTKGDAQKTIEQYLVKNNYDRRVARSLSEALASGEHSSYFYTKSIEFTIDRASGFDASVEFVNFIEVQKR